MSVSQKVITSRPWKRTSLKALLKNKLTALSIQGQPRSLKARRFSISTREPLPNRRRRIAQKKYLGNYGIVKSFISRTNKEKTRVQFDIPRPEYTLDLQLAKNADPDLTHEVSPGERHGFYCQITSVEKSSAVLSDCLPLRQFASLKSKQIEALIHRYLAGEKVLDPNLPTYAMMAYMAVVSARLLPRDSVCRRTVEDEIIFTDADRRLCNQEVADLWQRADSNPKFDKTMDNVVEELTKHGVDVSMINQAASSLD